MDDSRYRLRRGRPQPDQIPIPVPPYTQHRPRRSLPLPIPSDLPTRQKMVLRHRHRLGRTPNRASDQFNSRRVHATQHLDAPRNQNNDLLPSQEPGSEYTNSNPSIARRRWDSTPFPTNLSSQQLWPGVPAAKASTPAWATTYFSSTVSSPPSAPFSSQSP